MSQTTYTTARTLRIFSVILFSLLTQLLNAQTLATGTIVGRATDAVTHLALSGARVGIAGTDVETFTTQSGDYILLNVPAGVRTVEVNYVGYPMISHPVTVVPGQPVTFDAKFGDEATTELDKLVITGSKVGSARAINQQRAAPTFTSIIASDEIGRFPDQNAAESLQRIPGIALYRDQGEGRFIVVRGMRPDLNSVQINGISLASPERGDRTVALDVIPSDALGAVVVTKVPTPDMPGDAIGGAINMKTRSAFDSQQRQLSLSAQGQYNDLTGKYTGKFNGIYADTFKDGKVGVTFAPTWQERTFGSSNFEEGGDGWVIPANQSFYFLNNLAFRQYEVKRKRYGLNTALEFKPDSSTYFFIRAMYSRFTDEEQRYITFIPFAEGTITQLDATSATVTNMRRERHDVRLREKNQDLTSIVAGLEKSIGDWKIEGHAAFSEGTEERPDELTIRFRKSAANSTWRYSFANGTYNPVLTQTAGSDLNDPASFNQVSRIRLVNSPGEETENNYALNARRDFVLNGAPAYIKTGVQLRMKDKSQTGETIDYTNQPTSFTYAAFAEQQTNYPFFGGQRINARRAQAAFYAMRGGLTANRLYAESETADWNSTEDVTSLYAMGGVTFGKLNVLTGARFEQTQFESTGNTLLTSTTVNHITRGRDYDNLLPGLYLKYNLTKQTVLRAAWSNSLTRPGFDESSIVRSVLEPANYIKLGNPDLDPMESVNWDASIEHYLPSLGLISVGAFHKNIKNFAYGTFLPGTPNDPALGYPVSTFVNGPKATVSGVELAYQQQFTFLPKPLDGFGFMANATITESEAEYYRVRSLAFEKDKFIGQSDDVGNIALTYEKGGFFIRAAMNFRSPRLREDEPVGASKNEDRWVDDFKQFDVNASYKFNRHFEVFGEALNITDEPFRVYFGRNGVRLTQFEEYGWSANFGVRWKL